MDDFMIQLHKEAGKTYGQKGSCGNKIDYKSEETADKSAVALTKKRLVNGTTRELEAYPCYWCDGWHIGRKMTSEEIEFFQQRI